MHGNDERVPIASIESGLKMITNVLQEFLTALGHDVEVAVTPSRKKHGEMSVTLR